MDIETTDRLKKMAQSMRLTALEVGYNAGKVGAHFGGGFSAMEILAVLYGEVMQLPSPSIDGYDHFVLSKGHGTLAYYTALYHSGLIDEKTMFSFEENGGPLSGQPSRNTPLGIEFSSGSLGMGITFAVGVALALKKKKSEDRVYVLLGDGECNEGSVWEAAMAASQFKLDNLIAIVDSNGLQNDGLVNEVMNVSDPELAWVAFGWNVQQVDGHEVGELLAALNNLYEGRPNVILADTVKGKGVSFMEGQVQWHHGHLTDAQYAEAISEVKASL